MPFVTMGAVRGGNVRVGLEDSLFIGRGKLAESNAEQVAKIRRVPGECDPIQLPACSARYRSSAGYGGVSEI